MSKSKLAKSGRKTTAPNPKNKKGVSEGNYKVIGFPNKKYMSITLFYIIQDNRNSSRASNSEDALPGENNRAPTDCTNLSVLDMTRAAGFHHKDNTPEEFELSNNNLDSQEVLDSLSR